MLIALAITALAATPDVDPPRGIYDDPLSVVVTPEDGSVLCGLDGAAPTACPAAIEIATTTVLTAIEVAPDGTPGPEVVHTYVFPAATVAGLPAAITTDPVYGPELVATLHDLPAISIVGGEGITAGEVPVSFEWIDPDGEDLQVACGANETGATSPVYPKDSYRVHFRSEYGVSKLDFELYHDEPGIWPADSFDAISFRSHNHDSVFYLGAAGQYLRGPFMDETHLEMGHLAPHGRPAHLYLDGEYKGVYHVREHFSAAFMSSYLGGSEDDFEAVNGGAIEDGAGVGWARVVAAGSDWEAFTAVADEAQFVDYMIFNYYAANAWDWSSNHNWQAAGPASSDPRAGQWVFHSSDNDICLVYDWTTDITALPGPSSLFALLSGEGHPDFWALFGDRVHALLEGDGPLTAAAARGRYEALAAESKAAMVAESARWGDGWWERDDEWLTERDRLLDDWFPYRTDELLRQFRANGWYPLDGPSVDVAAGVVPAGQVVSLVAPVGAQLVYSVDGVDPRLPGGALAPSAVGPVDAAEVAIDAPTVLHVRTWSGGAWGPGVSRRYELDVRPPIALNEWNAVEPDRLLDDDGEDVALGRIEGNGGDWIELLVLEDGLDLRGWTIELHDRLGPAGTLTFGLDASLVGLPAGLILTISEDMPQDPSWDPSVGDWRMHLQAGADGPGDVISATAFDVTHLDWTAVLSDAKGHPQLGPVGEGVAPLRGLGGDEVGVLATTPGADFRRDDAHYVDSTRSTFGAANVWDFGAQDLDALRGLSDTPLDTAWTPPETGSVDSGVADSGARAADSGGAWATQPVPGCGCATGGGPGAVGLLAGLVVLARRRRAAVLLLAGCAGKPADSGPSSVDSASDSLSDSEPFETGTGGPACYRDADGDRFGDAAVRVDCANEGAVQERTDCDDLVATTRPGAPETCNGVDDDCDGSVDDEPTDGLPFYADADRDGWGSELLVRACALDEGLALAPGDCDDTDAAVHPGAVETCDSGDLDCDGVAGGLPGVGEDCPAVSCADALAARGEAADGVYWLELPSGTRAPIWCDMTTDGGGWTLGFARCSADLGSTLDFGASEVALGALAVDPEVGAGAASACTGWLDLNSFGWETLKVGAAVPGSTTYLSRDIPRSELRIAFGDDGYLLYGGSTGYFWCAGAASYTDAGVGAVNNPAGAPLDCKGHGSLGTGWDFSEADYGNAGLTQCGADASSWIYASWAGTLIYYGTPGGAHMLWVR